MNQYTGVMSSGYPTWYSVEPDRSAPGPPASTRAATRYAVSSGLASGMTCWRLNHTRSPTWTSQPSASKITQRRPVAQELAAASAARAGWQRARCCAHAALARPPRAAADGVLRAPRYQQACQSHGLLDVE